MPRVPRDHPRTQVHASFALGQLVGEAVNGFRSAIGPDGFGRRGRSPFPVEARHLEVRGPRFPMGQARVEAVREPLQELVPVERRRCRQWGYGVPIRGGLPPPRRGRSPQPWPGATQGPSQAAEPLVQVRASCALTVTMSPGRSGPRARVPDVALRVVRPVALVDDDDVSLFELLLVDVPDLGEKVRRIQARERAPLTSDRRAR